MVEVFRLNNDEVDVAVAVIRLLVFLSTLKERPHEQCSILALALEFEFEFELKFFANSNMEDAFISTAVGRDEGKV